MAVFQRVVSLVILQLVFEYESLQFHTAACELHTFECGSDYIHNNASLELLFISLIVWKTESFEKFFFGH